MAPVWTTKYGPRRVRHEPPTLEEALTAAEGLTDDFDQQLAIAADLMEWSLERTQAEGSICAIAVNYPNRSPSRAIDPAGLSLSNARPPGALFETQKKSHRGRATAGEVNLSVSASIRA